MMKRYLIALISLFMAAGPVYAISKDTPEDTTKKFIDAMLNAKKGDSASYKKIDQFINYEVITSSAIEPHKSKFSNAQSTKLKNDLTNLIRTVAYPRSGTFYKESKYKHTGSKKNGNRTLVIQETYLPKEDLELEIGYQWENINGNWMITDITFDEDSIVKDYQNQFGRIIGKNGVDGLLKKVEEKLKEVESQQ